MNTSQLSHITQVAAIVALALIALLCTATADTNTNKNLTGLDGYEIPYYWPSDSTAVLAFNVNGERNFTIAWDKLKRANIWTAYTLNDSNSVKKVKRSGSFYSPREAYLASEYRTTTADYRLDIPIDRGHLCPANDRRRSTEEQTQTNCLLNIAPQWHKHNISGWRRIENLISNKWNANPFRDTLYVVKGATLADSLITDYTATGLPISKYWWAAVLMAKDSIWTYNARATYAIVAGDTIWTYQEKKVRGVFRAAIGLVSPHTNNRVYKDNFKSMAVTIDSLEALTGLDLFCNLPDSIEEAVESSINLQLWGIEE